MHHGEEIQQPNKIEINLNNFSKGFLFAEGRCLSFGTYKL